MASIPVPAVLPPDDDKGPEIAGIIWTLVGWSTVLICARFYSKAFKLRRVAVDDGLMLLTWLCLVLQSSCLQVAIHSGLGHHIWYLSTSRDLQILRWAYIAQAFALLGPMFGRTSWCSYLLAILGKARKPWLRLPLWIFIVLQFALNSVLVIGIYVDCGTDLVKIGDPATTCYHHGPVMRYALAAAVLNAFLDLFLAVVPTLMVFRLRTTLKAKLSVVALLSLSFLAAAAAVWRSCEIPVLFSRKLDFTWTIVPYFEAAALEAGIIVVAGSLPVLGPIFKKRRQHRHSKIGSTASSKCLSGDSGEVMYNLGHALGVRMPQLGNHVTITAGPAAASSSETDILPMSPREDSFKLKVQTKRKHDVTVEYINADDRPGPWTPYSSSTKGWYDPTRSEI